jgi:hypothetical protein
VFPVAISADCGTSPVRPPSIDQDSFAVARPTLSNCSSRML